MAKYILYIDVIKYTTFISDNLITIIFSLGFILEELLIFKYHFNFKDRQECHFTLKLQLGSLSYTRITNTELPEWTRLTHHQCENCPLTTEEHLHCPIAVNLNDIIDKFSNSISYTEVQVCVESPDRIYAKDTTVHEALSSLIGIIMVTSGCPIMNILRPMVRFHLPFSNIEETIFRSVGSYLIIQYFKHAAGKTTDWKLKKLIKAYEEIQTVNNGMAKRLYSVSEADANANAVVILDMLAKELPYSILDNLKDLQYLYQDFI
jgi:hypothetical protein